MQPLREESIANTRSIILFITPEPFLCNVCDTIGRVGLLLNEKEQTEIGAICEECMTKALEAITGFKLQNMLTTMRKQSSWGRRTKYIREQRIDKDTNFLS